MRALVVLCLLSLPGLRASGQRPTLATLQSGDTIKVWAVAPRLNGETGVFDGFTSDTLTLQALPFAPTAVPRARVPYASLRRIDVRRGPARSTGRTIAGVLIGAAGGMLLGAALGPIIECGSSCGDEGDLEGLGGFLIGGTLGIVGGGIAGGVIGARPRPRWESVDLRR